MQSTDFYIENNIVKIVNGVKIIQAGVLPKRDFTCMYIPKTVTQIYPHAIECNVVYDGINISKAEITTYGCENIPRMAAFKKYQLDFTKMTKEAFLLLPLTNDAMKGYQANHIFYERLRQAVIPYSQEDSNFFKICYTMGLFTVPSKNRVEVEEAITYIYSKDINLDYLDELVLKDVDLTFIQLILGFYRNGKLLDFMPYYAKMYNKCKEICKIIKRMKEQKIYEKKKEIEKCCLCNEGIQNLVQELKELELYRKIITFSDIQDYFLNHSFVVREGNEALEQIMPTIKSHIYSQKSFDILQDIYEEAKKAKVDVSQVFTPLVGKYGQYTYRWLENDNVENLILGYLTNCCAKLNGAGEDIMHLSMIHPQVRTLVVYNGFKKIIGKLTVFYSLEGQYLLGNTIEIAHSFINSPKIIERQKQELLQTFLEGLKAQVTAMDKLGYMVREVRVGMLRNDLGEQLSNQYPVVNANLLPNIKYGDYIDDASNEALGQAILPIGKDVKR